MNRKEQLLASMKQGAYVITPNNRLSSELLTDFAKAFPQQIHKKPHCLPYGAFLINAFQQLCHEQSQATHPLLLTPHQTRHLWHQVLSTTEATVSRGLMNAVEEAWVRCNLWLQDIHHPAFGYTHQTRQFQHWALQFTHELQHRHAITESQLAVYLTSQNANFNATQIIWACFDDFTPQQKQLQHYLAAQNAQSDYFDLEEKTANIYQYGAQNEEDEYTQLFHWIKERLAQGNTRIGVVIPDLEKKSSFLQRKLQHHLSSEEFNISLGKPLADLPMVAHALSWLSLDGQTLNIHQARLLLSSPYLASSQSELLARAYVMENSFCLRELNFSQAAFVGELTTKAPKLAKLLQSIVSYPEEASVQTWITLFHQRLKNLGFPGEATLNSANYQCYQRLLLLFDEYKQLALITPSLNRGDALAAFKQLADSTIFQPQKMATPVQILGLLEASGCAFDSLWVTGLTDQCLPQSVKLSAFIPLSLQRDGLMPHADPARELYLAEKTISRLKNASSFSVFSYPRLVEDKPNMVSPLVSDLTDYQPIRLDVVSLTSALETVVEEYSLPFIGPEKISGGTAILANQAKCPFRAFAAHRLHVRNGLETSDGPDAKERGQLIHKVLELLWATLKSQKNLLQLEENALNQYIESAINTALEPIIQQRKYSFSPIIQEVELERLKQLVQASLDWERQRPAFEIEALEQEFKINLADMTFRVRVDRLDITENGQKWVIDYKTSLPQSLPWNEERPKEPQLLLYALLDDAINTLLFTQLKAGHLTPKGLSEEDLTTPGISSLKKGQTWTELRQYWHDQLNELAHEFIQGHCKPQPSSPSICQQCDYQNLCRFKVS
ncbi:PD-(D/E)XK nuclease family protein [Legionella hackeliae]|nr:PD-(D/E)XK nuclease family protein [Legionella hackeliae]KTD10469.1 recombinase B [Legionella hackeliae]STX49885.1 recombinase B [Legionella hackeliae]